jgi:hypothetical protein
MMEGMLLATHSRTWAQRLRGLRQLMMSFMKYGKG